MGPPGCVYMCLRVCVYWKNVPPWGTVKPCQLHSPRPLTSDPHRPLQVNGHLTPTAVSTCADTIACFLRGRCGLCATSCSIAVSTNQSGTGRPERALGVFRVCGVYRHKGINVKRFAPLGVKKEKLTQCGGNVWKNKRAGWRREDRKCTKTATQKKHKWWTKAAEMTDRPKKKRDGTPCGGLAELCEDMDSAGFWCVCVHTLLPVPEAGRCPPAVPPPQTHSLPAWCCAAWPRVPPGYGLSCLLRSPTNTHTHTNNEREDAHIGVDYIDGTVF